MPIIAATAWKVQKIVLWAETVLKTIAAPKVRKTAANSIDQ